MGKAKREQNQIRQRDVLGMCQSLARWEDVIKATFVCSQNRGTFPISQFDLFCFASVNHLTVGEIWCRFTGWDRCVYHSHPYNRERDYTKRMLRVFVFGLVCLFVCFCNLIELMKSVMVVLK